MSLDTAEPRAMSVRLRALASTFVIVSLLAACGGSDGPTTPTPGDSTPAHLVVVAGDSEIVGAGKAVVTKPAVRVTDEAGKPVRGITVSFSVVSGGGSISQSASKTDAKGEVAVGAWTLGLAGGINVLSAAVPSVPSVTFTAFGVTTGLAVGESHTCAIANGGAAYCWGENAEGELGDGSNVDRFAPTAVMGGHHFVFLGAGVNMTCGLTMNGTAYCWGYNRLGQLGVGDEVDRASPALVAGSRRFIALALGLFFGCGIDGGGAAYCWGANGSGQLGAGDFDHRLIPTAVSGGFDFAAITAGGSHACARTRTNATYCWGNNIDGEVGTAEVQDYYVTPAAVAGAPVIPVTRNLATTDFAAGGQHTCGITSSGAAYCWGGNSAGELGVGDMSAHNAPTTVTGGLFFASISANRSSTCGLTTSGVAYCWGENAFGQLGVGDKSDRMNPIPVSSGVALTVLVAGSFHSCGLTAAGLSYCWGSNSYGALGTGDKTEELTPTLVTGGLTFAGRP